ncbi:MAG: hypothetical protein EF813_06370 [Methanosarcinales archaeon]|nr:MAG: hypothetical protein EF813_06370 [Methanosarcinales archaeon]
MEYKAWRWQVNMSIRLLIAALIITSVLAVAHVCTAEAASVSIGDVTCGLHEDVTVPVVLSDVADYGTGTIKITYNPAVVHVTGVAGTPQSTVTPSINNTAGIVIISAWNMGGVSGDVLFANVTLRSVGPCQSPLNLMIVKLNDNSFSPIPAATVNGLFTTGGHCTPQSFAVTGYIFYPNGSVCNGPFVGVTNPDRGAEWQAETDSDNNHYRISLILHNDVDLGETLRFNATDGSRSTEIGHGISLDEINSVGFSLNITIGQIQGDLNGDYKITSEDAAIALQMVVRGEYSQIADVNEDGWITALDVLMILRESTHPT